MAASARIDDLRQRYEENPRRYFAPLANEYRKAGDLATAIRICRLQLQAFPEHMSGHVVLGQALFEAGERDEARLTFTRALELDPENLIALRHLGDLAREHGDVEGARTWYRRILDADPRNEEIAAVVAQLTAAPAPAPAPASWVAPPLPVEGAPRAEPMPGPFGRERADEPLELPEAAEWIEGPGAFEPLDLEPFDAVPPADGVVQVAPDAPEAGEGAPGSGDDRAFAALDLEPLDFGALVPEGVDREVLQPDMHRSDLAPGDAIAPLEDLADFEPVVGLDLPPELPEAPVAAALALGAEQEREEAGAARPDAAAPEQGLPRTTPADNAVFVTETMATVLLQQGHVQQAVGVLEALVAQRPGDAALAARLDAVRAAHGIGTVPEMAAPESVAPAAVAPEVAALEPVELALREPERSGEAEPTVPESAAPEPWELATAAAEPQSVAADAAPDTPPTDAPTDDHPLGAAAPAPGVASPGPSADDERMAGWLAGGFASEAPSGPSLADELFAEGSDGRGDAAPDASPDLSFERFFVGFEPSASVAAPAVTPSDDPAPATAPPIDARPPAAVAADRTIERTVTPDRTAAATAPDTDEDLAQFNAWLRGLLDS